MAVFDIEAFDRQLVGIEAGRDGRQRKIARAVDSEVEFRPDQMQFLRAPLSTHQRAELQFDRERTRAHAAAGMRGPHFQPAQDQHRAGQEGGFDRPGDADGRADQAACLGFDGRTEPAPVHHQWADQRRHQRQDQRYRHSQERCLHAISAVGTDDDPG